MNNVLDIARYIINYSNDRGYSISNLKLQKLLYFVQGVFLAETGKVCFPEEIEAWDFGPVVPNAYHEFKKYGSMNIPKIESFIKFEDNIWESERVNFNMFRIDKETRERVNRVVDQLSDFSATQLVRITHSQAPWINNYSRGRNRNIPIFSIKEFFNE